MMTYATFTEFNDWEGETWRFYIPLAGNKEELRRLERLVRQAGDDAYEVNLMPVSEDEVDDRVANLACDTTYMPAHTKLEGRLRCPTNVDDLYKGGIRDFME